MHGIEARHKILVVYRYNINVRILMTELSEECSIFLITNIMFWKFDLFNNESITVLEVHYE